MGPELILLLLLSGLVALLPVRRLHEAGWATGPLFTAWFLYALGLFAGMRLPGLARFLLPVVAIAFVAPFVAGPRRLAALGRLFGARPAAPHPIIDVTPPSAPGLPGPAGQVPEPPRRRRKPPVEERD
jgi:hypothetical protein